MENIKKFYPRIFVVSFIAIVVAISLLPQSASAAKYRPAPFELFGSIDGKPEYSNKNWAKSKLDFFESAWNSKDFTDPNALRIEVIKNTFSGSWKWRDPKNRNHIKRLRISGTYEKGYLVGTWHYTDVDPWEDTDTNHGPYTREEQGGGSFTSEFIGAELGTVVPVKVEGSITYTYGDLDPKSEPGKGIWIQKEEVQDLKFTWKAQAGCMYECGCDEGVGENKPTGTKFNSLSGTVEVQHCGEDPNADWQTANMKDEFYASDHVKTMRNSSAILQFSDMNTYVMRPETEIVLNAPPEKDNWPKLNLVLGRLWKNTKLIIKEDRMEAETSQAVLGIKGTTFYVEADGEKTTVGVAEGLVTLTSKFTDKTVDIGPGQMAVADFNDVSEPTPIDASVLMSEYETAYADATSGRPASPEDVVVDDDNEVDAPNPKEENGIALPVIITLAIVIGGVWVIKKRKI